MDIFSLIITFIGIAYIGFTMYLANQEAVTPQRGGLLRGLLYGVAGLAFVYNFIILQSAFLPADPQSPPIGVTAALISFGLTMILSIISAQIVASELARTRLRRWLPGSASYDPNSVVHTTAVVLVLALISLTVGQFVMGGGISGLAQNLAAEGVNYGDMVFEESLWVFAALLGVGFMLRRTPQQTLIRLGLRLPTRENIRAGIVTGLALYGLVIVMGIIWTLTVSPEQLQQQTAASQQLARSFNSLGIALVISLAVGIGEEIFFRGALQPVFGNLPTSLVFAVLHTQYTLTPATILILVTSLGFGWVRSRYNTSASIIAHFVYDFVQLALAIFTGGS